MTRPRVASQWCTMVAARKKRGISVAESLIACVLISGIAVALFGVWAMHAKAVGSTRDLLVAEALCRQWMETAVSRGYTITDESPHTTPPTAPFIATHYEADREITREYFFGTYYQDGATATNPGVREVKVEVDWEHGGKWRHVELHTRLSWQG